MRDFLKDQDWSYFYLGGAISYFAHTHWYMWQFWAIVIPFFLIKLILNKN